MKIKPLYNQIVVKVDNAEKKTSSGLIIPVNAEKKTRPAVIVAVGRGNYNEVGMLIPLEVNVGDNVLLPGQGGIETKIENETYLIFKESDVICVLVN